MHERVPAGVCYVIVVMIPAAIICFWTLIIDGLFAHSQPTDSEGTGRRLGRYRLVDRLWELNCGILGLALSEGTAFVITGELIQHGDLWGHQSAHKYYRSPQEHRRQATSRSN